LKPKTVWKNEAVQKTVSVGAEVMSGGRLFRFIILYYAIRGLMLMFGYSYNSYNSKIVVIVMVRIRV